MFVRLDTVVYLSQQIITVHLNTVTKCQRIYLVPFINNQISLSLFFPFSLSLSLSDEKTENELG